MKKNFYNNYFVGFLILIIVLICGCEQKESSNRINNDIKEIHSAKELINNVENLSKIKKGDLYRFYGMPYNAYETENDDKKSYYTYGVKNYICFGTENKDECLSKKSNYLYQILGVSDDGSLKLILESYIGKEIWSSNELGNVEWPNSKLYIMLNGEQFYNNKEYLDDNWKSIIETKKWYYGVIEHDKLDFMNYWENDIRDDIIAEENNSNYSYDSKIGLLSVSDFFYSYDLNNVIGKASDIDENSNYYTWITFKNNNRYAPFNDSEWLINIPDNHWFYNAPHNNCSEYGKTNKDSPCYYDESCHADIIYNSKSSGGIFSPTLYISCNSNHNYRPVFYTKNNINFLSGDGSPDNPYIIDLKK